VARKAVCQHAPQRGGGGRLPQPAQQPHRRAGRQGRDLRGAFPPLVNPFGTPNSVGNDTFQSANLFGFDESQNTTLTAALTPDLGSALASGTVVASHYIFFDPTSGSVQGTVDFDSDVLAVLTSAATESATDYLAKTGVTYLSLALRGLEAGDSVSISGARQISFSATAATPGDYLRVLTRFSPGAVPEPGGMALVAAALARLALTTRRRKA
jgi:hypothetical protein